jgi:hypothetical protein
MSKQIDWSKAPEGATQYVINSVGPWEKIEAGRLYYWYKGDWLKLPWRGNDSCPEIKIVKRPQPTQWSGEGLPPAGVVCEIKSMARGSERDWFKASVLYSSAYTIVLDDYRAGEFVAHPATLQFRPIRIPEQIAADEREAAILELIKDAGKDAATASFEQARKIYDAGWRKQQTKECK